MQHLVYLIKNNTLENNSNNNSSNPNRSWEDNNYSNQSYDSTNQQQSQGGQNWNSQPYRSKLPADPSALVLAIIATVLLVICCCFGGQYIALVLSIIGFVIAQSSINKYRQNAQMYNPNSLKKVNNAKIFNLVVGIVSLLFIILSLFGLFANTLDKYEYNFNDFDDDIYEEDYEHNESDYEDDWYEYEEEVDTLNQSIDTLETEEIETIIEETAQE